MDLSLSSHPFFPLTFEIPPLAIIILGVSSILQRIFRGIESSQVPWQNVLLLDKNEPMICDNSLDLFFKN